MGASPEAGTDPSTYGRRHATAEPLHESEPTMPQHPELRPDPSRGWARVAVVSGWTAAVALVTTTVLYLLDATDALAASPVFHRTAAGVLSDEAEWYVAYFHRQHEVLWSIVARDLVGPAGFVALAVLAVAVVRLTGWSRPAAVLGALLLAFGALLHVVSDLLYLGEVSYWRETGWSPDPPALMVSIGRASESLDNSTTYLEAVSYLVLAAALVGLAVVCRSDLRLPSWLGTLAVVEAAGLVVLFLGIALQQDTLFQLAGAATGVVAGPLFAALLGRRVAQALGAGGQAVPGLDSADEAVTARA